MTHSEFKEILESIEFGLYQKWEDNFKADKDNFGKDISQVISNTSASMLVSCKFIWSSTDDETQGQDFWCSVDLRYRQVLREWGIS